MAKKPQPPVVFDDDNPEWTREDFARARPADEVLPADVAALLVRKPPPEDFDENPIWTAEDFARARPASEVHGAEIAAAMVRKPSA